MGNLLARLWQAAFGAAEFKIVFVGLNNAGKTTIVYRLSLGQVVATTPTIGSNVEEFTHGNVKFLVWDVGGQESLRDTWTTYYANARVCSTPPPPSDPQRSSPHTPSHRRDRPSCLWSTARTASASTSHATSSTPCWQTRFVTHTQHSNTQQGNTQHRDTCVGWGSRNSN